MKRGAHIRSNASIEETGSSNQIAVDALAHALKAVLEAFQDEAAQSTASGVAVTLRSIELEVKGFVDMHEQATRITVPKLGEPVDPDTLSVLRMSFVAVPTLRLDDGDASGA